MSRFILATPEIKKNSEAIRALREGIAKATSALNDLHRMYKDGFLDKATYEDRREAIQDQVSSMEAEVEARFERQDRLSEQSKIPKVGDIISFVDETDKEDLLQEMEDKHRYYARSGRYRTERDFKDALRDDQYRVRSWGGDVVLVDFYKVVKVSPDLKKVTMRKLEVEVVNWTSDDSGHAMPSKRVDRKEREVVGEVLKSYANLYRVKKDRLVGNLWSGSKIHFNHSRKSRRR